MTRNETSFVPVVVQHVKSLGTLARAVVRQTGANQQSSAL